MNVLKPDKKATLVTLLKNNISQREISRKAKIDRKTIRKYLLKNGLGAFPENSEGLPPIDVVATGGTEEQIQNPPPGHRPVHGI